MIPIFAIAFLASHAATISALSVADCRKIRVLSLDVTGTLLATKEPVIESYHKAALWVQLPHPPSPEELKAGFKAAYKERCIESPCFGGAEGIPGRDWWYETVRRVLYKTGREYPQEDYDRYFRRVYQHFGSTGGYRILEDAQKMIDALNSRKSDRILLGITSNLPTRDMESVLPMMGCFHDNFHFFTCAEDVGVEKPEAAIFDKSFRQAKFWIPDLQKDEILHIGDSYPCDYCGAKAYGFQALMLDRSSHPAVMAYQDWVKAPDFPGKTIEEVQENTITSLEEVVQMLDRMVDEEVEIEKVQPQTIKPKVVVKKDGESRQESIKPHKTKADEDIEEVKVKSTGLQDEAEDSQELEVKGEAAVVSTMEEEIMPPQMVEEQLPAPSPERSEPMVGVDDLTPKFDERRPRYREPITTLRFNSLGQIIDEDGETAEAKPPYVASVENLGYQVQQQYSTDSWFDAKSKVTASLYNTKKANKGKQGDPVRPAKSNEFSSWFDNQSNRETKKWTSANQSDAKPCEATTKPESSPHYFGNLYSQSNPLEDFRDIKSPPIYDGSQHKKWKKANRSDNEPSHTEPLLESMDRDIASGRHLSKKYAADYTDDDFRDIQSPPIYGTEKKEWRRATKSDIEPNNVSLLLEDMDRNIADGRHLTNRYADDYSEDDFRDIQSPPIF